MDKATETMIENLQKNTGKSLEQWIGLVRKKEFAKHGEIMTFLKSEHQLTHGFANFIALKARGTDSGSAANPDDLVAKQYLGKEHFLPVYERLLSEVKKFGDDIEVSPKNAYVSLRRKKQFATLQPITKTRFEIGINLKGQTASGKLEAIHSASAMCSHKINLTGLEDVDKEVIKWMRTAYDNA